MTIRIAVDPDTGNITYVPSVTHVRRGDSISWRANGHFAIMFRDGTPADHVGIQSGPEQDSAPLVLRKDAPLGHYHYQVAVAVETPGGLRVFLDAGCPDIIVD